MPFSLSPKSPQVVSHRCDISTEAHYLIGGLLWSYLKEHGNVLPLVGGILMGVTLYVGRYVYMGAVINQVLMYGGIAGIIAISFWNLRLRKKAACPACVSGKKG